MNTLATKYEKLVKDEIETDAETLAIDNVGKQDPKKHLQVVDCCMNRRLRLDVVTGQRRPDDGLKHRTVPGSNDRYNHLLITRHLWWTPILCSKMNPGLFNITHSTYLAVGSLFHFQYLQYRRFINDLIVLIVTHGINIINACCGQRQSIPCWIPEFVYWRSVSS